MRKSIIWASALLAILIGGASLLDIQTQPAEANIQWTRFDFFNNSGGLNDGFSPIDIQDNEASALQNVVFTTGGNFKTRDGFSRLNSVSVGASTDCNGVHYFRQADATEFLVAVFSDNTVRKMDYSGGDPDGTWDDITGALTFSVTQNDLSDFTIGEDTTLFTDGLGTNGVYEWTGAGNATLVSGAPDAKYVTYHKRMAFAAGDTSNPSLISFTDVGDISNWTTGLSGNVSVDTTDGSIVRGLEKLADNLYIFTDNSIWRLSGDDKDNFRLKRMVSGIGTLSNFSIVQILGQLFFQSKEGHIYIYDGGFGLERINPKIEGTTDSLNKSRLFFAVGEEFDNDYYLSVSSSGAGQNDTVLLFDTFNLAWSKFLGMNSNAFTVANISNGTETLVFGDYGGFVSKHPDGTNDAGTAISDFYQSKQFRFPEMSTEKFLRLLKIYANQAGNYNLEVEVKSDFESTGTTSSISLSASGALWDTAVYDVDSYADDNLTIGRIELDKGNEFFQVRFSNANLDEPTEVKGWAMFLERSDNI